MLSEIVLGAYWTGGWLCLELGLDDVAKRDCPARNATTVVPVHILVTILTELYSFLGGNQSAVKEPKWFQ
jgi:hypothetical protein